MMHKPAGASRLIYKQISKDLQYWSGWLGPRFNGYNNPPNPTETCNHYSLRYKGYPLRRH